MRLLGLVTMGVVGLFSASAHAGDKLSDAGTLIVSAERISPLIAYNNTSTKRTELGTEITETSTSTTMSLLANPSPTTVYNVPRLAFDYSVGGGLTVGGAVTLFFTLSAEDETKTGSRSQSNDAGKTTVLGIAPRIGYVLPLGEVVAFWPRLGFSYIHAKYETPERTTLGVTSSSSASFGQWGLHVEPMFVIAPVRHFAFTLGPVVDLPLSGTRKTETTTGSTTRSEERDASQLHIGLTAGLLGWF